jgi:hypothetical protein
VPYPGHEGRPGQPLQMVQLLAGFQLSQALYAAAKLGVADQLRGGLTDATSVAAAVGGEAQSLRRLLRTLASIGVFTETEDGRFGLTPLGGTLTTDSPTSMRDLAIMWMETHYGPFGGLLDTVRTGRCAATEFYGQPFFGWLSDQPEHIARFSRAMAKATGVIFDLPHVVAEAEPWLAWYGLGDRLTAAAGDFFAAVPGDAHTYLLSMILHDWSDTEASRLLASIRAATGAGGLHVRRRDRHPQRRFRSSGPGPDPARAGSRRGQCSRLAKTLMATARMTALNR